MPLMQSIRSSFLQTRCDDDGACEGLGGADGVILAVPHPGVLFTNKIRSMSALFTRLSFSSLELPLVTKWYLVCSTLSMENVMDMISQKVFD